MNREETKWKARIAVEVQKVERLRLAQLKLAEGRVNAAELGPQRQARIEEVRKMVDTLEQRIIDTVLPLSGNLHLSQVEHLINRCCKDLCNEMAGT
jgi:hypothetical protein